MWRLSRIFAGFPLSTFRTLQVLIGYGDVFTHFPNREEALSASWRGEKIVCCTREVEALCRKRIVLPLERLHSLSSMLRDELKQFQEHIVNCIQKPSDMVFFSSTQWKRCRACKRVKLAKFRLFTAKTSIFPRLNAFSS